MPAPHEGRPALGLDPLHSPGSHPPEQQQQPIGTLALRAEAAGPTFRQNQAPHDAADPMAKTKRRMFSTPLLRRSATASSAAAASAASRIKNNLSTVSKLPTALKRNSANSGSAVPVASDGKASVDRAPTVPSLSRSSTESSVTKEETKAASSHGRMFGIPSLMRIRTGSKEKTHSKPMSSPVYSASSCALDSPEAKSRRSYSGGNNSSETEASNDDEVHETARQHQSSAISTASRFVMGMPTLLRRAVSNNHTPPSADAPAATQKKSPDTSANSTPRGESPEDDLEENDRHSLLLMLQVPEARYSQIPLMAASEAW
ncbi:hypothetical protein PHYPSEUDO_012187 [Phytophthora pseudosyringae]|uniref:Uncharacterized protein n=1 Tax=Phytophthora pseudosyringae TaxID=221518 RepID=A0A8T1W8N6_9STRA|nr:hypothetical protein PHYPSEUDO_012187 [Phytophthora pseudosyringae]